MKKQTLSTTLILTLLTLPILSQSKRVADRYFEEFAYFKAAKIYEAVYEKGDTSKYVLKRIGDSYYNNSRTEEAEIWYRKLIEKAKETDPNYLFKYAQVLKSNGDTKKSDSIYLVLNKTNPGKDKKKYIDKEDQFQDFLNGGRKKISVRNLATNTSFSDFGGVIFNDEIYYASAAPKGIKGEKVYRWNNQPFLNLYKSKGYIQKVEGTKADTIYGVNDRTILTSPVNTSFHESSAVFTKDGKYMYFSRVNFDGKKLRKDKKQTVNLKLYKAENNNGNWENVEELPFNSDDYSVGHPALSPDEKTLYFTSDMPGSLGATDIFKVEIKEDGYGVPTNLGESVNTPEREMFPFVAENNVLFFSSNGHRGLGLLDIFQTKIYEDGTFSKVVNLDFPFNSKKDDFSFYVDSTGKKGFFSSNRSKGKGDDDIYSFYISELPKPKECLQSITGTLTDKVTKAPIANAIIKLVDKATGTIVNEALTDINGKYSFDKVVCGNDTLSVIAEQRDYRSAAKKDFNLTKENGKIITIDLMLDPLIVGNQIVIKPIYFDFNKSYIRDDAQYELENIVAVMNNHPKMIIKIESHTDSRGGKLYNRKLSDRRAKSTREFLISRGIAPKRVESAIGYGEDQLLNHCNDKNSKKCSEEEHQLNRRSYFYIVSGKNDITVENSKPRVIDRKGYKDQKAIMQRLRMIRKPKSRGKLFKRRSRSDNKCYSEKDSECNKLLK
ncbi:OmpA family protein [Tenacibaculum jejuense]|uniref:Outer membrane lipoprotein omp16 n=1 Tax=Tenacibaculum jejuense TaxID=584609 RepID=A0A238U876_9FLAO|nr:OmpA family protein [Tenacibaculum jejuense]SNR15245.1 Outer membrane lipoprotein omp16 [Tenacibaculum jejuense]